MNETSQQTSAYWLLGAILLTTVVCGLSIAAWLSTRSGFILSALGIFPVLGLLAFSIMWSQYMMEAIKNYLDLQSPTIRLFFAYSSRIVLLLILLHPAILIATLYQNGAGLPPGSYREYVAPGMTWLVTLGMLGLLAFIAFEFRKFFESKGLWGYVAALNDLAIVAIFYHGLRLGSDVQTGWFQPVWYMYGMTLLLALAYKYYLSFRQRDQSKVVT